MHGRRNSGKLRLWGLLALLVLAFAAIAAGCGDDDEDGGDATTAAAPPTSAAEPTTAAATTEAATDTAATDTAATDTAATDTGATDTAATDTAASDTAAATGSTDTTPIKIGILTDCEGAFASFYEATVGGAQIALIQRGATKAGEKPTDGLENASVAGRPIEITGYGCSDDTADKAIEEVRRLVEQLGSEIVIGPLSGDEGIAVANYALEHPEVTFVNGSAGAQDATLKVGAENFFRFNADGAQMNAGLGDYAYNTLGWRTAAVIGDDYSFPYTSLAGFIAEFCALGGSVESRVWPALGETDYSSFISQIPEDVDGVMVGIGGSGLITFIKQYEQARGKIEGDKFMGNVFWPDPLVLAEIGEQLEGGVAGSPTAGDSTEEAAVAWSELVDSTYPVEGVQGTASSIFTYTYWANMDATLQALEQVGADLSDGHAAFREALAGVTVKGGYGDITLDENRQAVLDNYVQQVVKTDDGYGVKTILRIPGVEQTFGGAFTADTPPPDRENPECKPLDTPLPWVGNAEELNYGG